MTNLVSKCALDPVMNYVNRGANWSLNHPRSVHHFRPQRESHHTLAWPRLVTICIFDGFIVHVSIHVTCVCGGLCVWEITDTGPKILIRVKPTINWLCRCRDQFFSFSNLFYFFHFILVSWHAHSIDYYLSDLSAIDLQVHFVFVRSWFLLNAFRFFYT